MIWIHQCIEPNCVYINVFVVVAFLFDAHDYGNSTMTDWPASVRIMDWLSTGLKKKKMVQENMDL